MKRYCLDDNSLSGIAAHDDGDFVFYADALKESAELRGKLSLAEEGLANYAKESARLNEHCAELSRQNHNALDEIERLRAALERIKQVRYGLEQGATDDERAGYWGDMALAYRQIASEALRSAEPQSAEHK